MKKLLSVLLILMLTAAIFSGCNSGTTEVEEGPETAGGTDVADVEVEDPAANEVLEPDVSELEFVTLKITYMGAPQEDEEAVEAAMNEYLKDKINCAVDIMPIGWGEYKQNTNMMIAAGEQLDLMFTASWYDYFSNVEKKAFVPLDDLLAEHGQGILEVLPDYLIEGPKVDGELYGVSTNKEAAVEQGFLFNKALVEKYDFDVTQIKTYDDLQTVLKPMLETIKENEPGIVPFAIKNGQGLRQLFTDDAIGDASSPGVYHNGEVVLLETIPEVRQLIDITYDWMQSGLINEDAATNQELLTNMFCQWSSLKPGKAAEMEGQFGMELIQVGIGDKILRTRDTSSSMTAIPVTTVDAERAMMFLNLMYTDKYLNNLFNYGIEGTHFVKVSDNVIDYVDGQDATSVTYDVKSHWMFYNQMLNYLRTNEDPQKWELFAEFNDSAQVSELMGFNFNPEPVAAELAACKTQYEEHFKAIASGTFDPAEAIDKYHEALKDNGLDKILEEKTKQVNEFLAGK